MSEIQFAEVNVHTTVSGLAAVAEAAKPGPWAPPGSTKPLPASTSAAPPKAPSVAPAAAPIAVPPKQLTEADRLAAIDAQSLPGCELVAEDCKSDPSVTPAMAAPRILTAYRANLAIARGDAAAAATDLRQEWEAASPSLRGEFGGSFDVFSGYRHGVAAGRIRETRPMGNRSSPRAAAGPVNLVKIAEDARVEWNASAELQAEFSDVATYVALRKGEAQGRIKVHGGAVQR
jgi:hypothetical protein